MRLFTRSLLLISLVSAFSAAAQKKQVRAAWRSLSDYEETLKEGRPNQEFLVGAQSAIDQAFAHPDTRNDTKTLAYRFRVYYALYRLNLENQVNQLKEKIQDKDERLVTAYGETPLTEFEIAAAMLDSIRIKDPAYLEKTNEALKSGGSSLDEDDSRFANAVQQMKLESANIATGKYRNKQYDAAADYFYKTAVMKSVLLKTKDTLDFYNACVAAGRSKDPARITKYNKAMIDAGLATPYNYESLYNVHLASGDSAEAIRILRTGREKFPADATLLTQETNLFLATNRHRDALENLEISSKREPANPLYYFVIGNIYDNLANPKDQATGKDLSKPAEFNEYFEKAEENYKKAIELNPSNQEYLYNSLYNLGAMYNNYGGFIATQPAANTKAQKENDLKAQGFYKKAIPYLEQALTLRKDDKPTMAALRKLYLLTRNDQKAKEMSDRLKAVQ